MVYSILLYHLLFILTLSFVFISQSSIISFNKLYSNFFVFLSFVIIILFTGLRYDVGKDYMRHVDFFYFIKKNEYINIELGYYWLNLLFKDFKYGYVYVFFICSLLTYIFLYMALIKKRIIFLGLFFYFCFYFFLFNTLIRQSVSISIFLYSLKYVEERKMGKFFLFILIGFLFHKSILLMVPVYFFKKINISKGLWMLIIFVAFLMIFTNSLESIFTKYLMKISYINYYMGGKYAESNINTGLGVLIKMFFGIVIILYKDILIKKDNNNLLYVNIFLIGVVLSIFAAKMDIISRLAHYFYITGILIFPNLFQIVKRNKLIIIPLLIFFSLALFEKQLIIGKDNNVNPYQTILRIK